MKKILLLTLAFPVLFSCKKDKTSEAPAPSGPYSTIENTCGYGLFSRIKGIWNGTVSSTTALGGYPEWIVDFRPVSENQVSAKNELDPLNDIHMSFFIAKYNGEYRVAFRNGGSFGGQSRVSYFLADSVSETPAQSFYRFTEIVKGKSRAYTDVIFKDDSLLMFTYTNQYNALETAVPHMAWKAKLQDQGSCQDAVSHFGFPKKTLARDFSSAFQGLAETIYYSLTGGDPYPEAAQPYLGKVQASYSFPGTFTPDPSKKVFLFATTQPLISGFSVNAANLKYRSRYVVLPANDLDYTFNYMHPGTYYIYALYDADGNNAFSAGDMVSAANTAFTLGDHGEINTSAAINFTIP